MTGIFYPPPLLQPSMYVKKCPLWGLDLGIGPFKTVHYADAEVSSRHCGRNTTYEDGHCVPTREPRACDGVRLEQPLHRPPLHIHVRRGWCHARGCSFDPSADACTDRRECQTNLDEGGCAANNANCEWDAGRCALRSNRAAPTPLRAACDGTAVPPHALCGDGTKYDARRHMCEAVVR